MLRKLRERKNIKRIMFFTAILIIPAFVLWGVGSALKTQRSSSFAGTVFSQKITIDEFMKQYRAVYNQAQLIYGENLAKLQDYLNLEGQTWQRIILLKESKIKKIAATDEEVISQIKSSPIFQKKGDFDRDTYETILRYYLGLGSRDYEEQVRNNLKIKKLLDGVTAQINIEPEENWQEYKKENDSYKLSYILFKPSGYLKNINHTPEDLHAFYEANKERFKKPEQVNISYLKSDFTSFVKEVVVTIEEIEDYYYEHEEELKKSAAISSQEPDAIEEINPLIDENIKTEIENTLKEIKSRQLAEDSIWNIEDALVSGTSWEDIAKRNNTAIQETGFFSPWDPVPGIGWAYKITQTAFTLEPGKVSEIIEMANAFYIIKVKEKKAPYIPAYKEIENEIETSYKDQRAQEIALQDAKDKLNQIVSLGLQSDTTAQLLADSNLSFKDTGYILRNNYIPEVGNASDIIDNLETKEIEALNPEVIKSAAGYLIVKLDAINEADIEEFENNKEAFSNQILAQKKEEYLKEWFEKLQDRSDIEIYFQIPR